MKIFQNVGGCMLLVFLIRHIIFENVCQLPLQENVRLVLRVWDTWDLKHSRLVEMTAVFCYKPLVNFSFIKFPWCGPIINNIIILLQCAKIGKSRWHLAAGSLMFFIGYLGNQNKSILLLARNLLWLGWNIGSIWSIYVHLLLKCDVGISRHNIVSSEQVCFFHLAFPYYSH